MIPTICHSRKGKTMEAVKGSVVDGINGEGGVKDGAQRLYRAVVLIWYYNDGYTLLHMYPDP